MLATYSHTRAAILAFGGWGLQTAFHLLPRLQAAQEQRAALGAVGPDLGAVTRMGAVFPEWQLDGDGQAHFTLHALPNDADLPPYLVEHLLESMVQEDDFVPLTAAEQRAAGLREALSAYMDNLTPRLLFPREAHRALRRDHFAAALRAGDETVRLLETHIIDPIRTDILDPDDPFVQTTLYVVAPLFEPGASALIWPIVSRLMARIGRRHISQVVGLFATGSYAGDLTRSVEDGAAYAALNELEILTGLRTADAGVYEEWRNRVGRNDPTLAEHVGEQLFDFIYLLDREKSNQSLVHDSHELAVLASNALEAMIVAGGNLFIQEQLGIGLRVGDGRPYSLLGAAGDYVPVSQILHAINRQEESRLVREWVLRSTPHAPNPLVRTAPPQLVSLADLGLVQPAALAQVTARTPSLFVDQEPVEIDDLAVKRDFIWPATLSGAPFRTAPRNWPQHFAQHEESVDVQLQLAAGPPALDEVWGISAADHNAEFETAVDDRLLPSTVHKMHRKLVELIVASPAGLNNAQRQVQQWLVEGERARRRLEPGSSETVRTLASLQQRSSVNDWQLAYRHATAKTPVLYQAILRAVALTILIALIAYIYLFFVDQQWRWENDGLTLAGFGVGALAAAGLVYRTRLQRTRRLQQQRIDLAQARFTAQLQTDCSAALLQVHDSVLRRLRAWSEMLADARHELHALSSPPSHPLAVPELAAQNLYADHPSDELIDFCAGYLRERQDQHGRRTEDRLDVLWGETQWRADMREILRGVAGSTRPINVRRAQTIADYIRKTVRESVAPASLERFTLPRAELIRELAGRFSIEHQLWRNRTDRLSMEQQLQAMATGLTVATSTQADLRELRRYMDTTWNRAKPAANYDVSDRLAVYAITIDFMAASGALDSDMARAVNGEFNLTLLPTQDPFSIFFVRTVHGIGRHDLDSMRRYRSEFLGLTADERALVALVDEQGADIYAVG